MPPHVAENVGEARALYDIVKTQGRDGAAGIVQVEKPLGRLEFEHEQDEATARVRSRGRQLLLSRDRGAYHLMRTVAYYKGCLAALSAKELDISTQALAPRVGLENRRASSR